MAENYDDSKFNLKQDWYWHKVIGKRDELLYNQIQEDMREILLEYLDLGSESEFTKETIEELKELVRYLEAGYDEGGCGFSMDTSQHFYGLWYQIEQWCEYWDTDEWANMYGE